MDFVFKIKNIKLFGGHECHLDAVIPVIIHIENFTPLQTFEFRATDCPFAPFPVFRELQSLAVPCSTSSVTSGTSC